MKFKLYQTWLTRNGDTAKIMEVCPNGWMYCQSTNDGQMRMYDAEGNYSCPDLDLMEIFK